MPGVPLWQVQDPTLGKHCGCEEIRGLVQSQEKKAKTQELKESGFQGCGTVVALLCLFVLVLLKQ